MPGTGRPFDSLRLSRFENERLVFALLLSLAAHAIAFGGYELGKEFQLFQWLHRAAKVQPVPLPVQNFEQPLEFVTVDRPSTEAPKNAKYYSSQNSLAANPDANQDTDTPKVNGTQTVMPKTEDELRQQISKSQPTPQTQPADKSQQQPSPAIQPGDLTLLKLENLLPKNNPEPERIRKLSHLPGVKMKQDGGVSRRLEISTLDAQGTPFGKYDQALVDAVTQRWYDLLDKHGYAFDRLGDVVVVFSLHSDGRITDVKLVGDTMDEKMGGMWAIYCQAALEEAAPFAPWPSEMLHLQGSNSRDLTFSFHYYLP